MSYLTLAKGIPDFSKAVISFWFRAPKASIDAAAAQTVPPAFSFILPRVIPLMTFGKALTQKRLEGITTQVATYHYEVFNTATGAWETPPIYTGDQAGIYGPVYDTPTYKHVADDPIETCSIGLNCEGGTATLRFNIQLATTASIVGYDRNLQSQDFYSSSPDYNSALGSGWSPAGAKHQAFTIFADTSFRENNKPEFFLVESPKIITPDHWHHLLLSFDLSQSCNTSGPERPTTANEGASFWDNVAQGTSSFCQLWYAIDNVDYRGRADDYEVSRRHNLGPYSVDYDLSGTTEAMGDPNGILTFNAFNVAGNGSSWQFNCPAGPSTCTYVPAQIPSNDAAIGIPSSTMFVDHIYRVEMAELQIWTGVTLDTQVLGNRRAFIDSEGHPVNPTKSPITGDNPDGLPPAVKLLGKKPEVLLHGSSNWKTGYNTGTTGITIETDTDGNDHVVKIPEGQFKPTGGIEQYTPDPALEESTA